MLSSLVAAVMPPAGNRPAGMRSELRSRSSRFRWGTPAVTCLCALVTSITAVAGPVRPDRIPVVETQSQRQLASAQTLRPVRLKSGTFVGAGDLAANLADAFAAAPGAGRVHVLVQFAKLPAPAARERLEASGVRLLDYLPEHAYFVSLPRDADPTLLARAGARWLGPIYPEDKLSATLEAGTPGAWATLPDGSVKLRARVFADVPLAAAQTAVEQTGATVTMAMTAAGQLEIRAAADRIGALAAADALRWIEEVPPPMTTFNDGIRTNTQAYLAQAAPYNLSGTNVTVAMWDAGWVDFAHPDFGGRAKPGEANVPTKNHPHSTHVAGTLVGSGANSAAKGGTPYQWRGMAPGATLISYDVDTGSILDEHRDALQRYKAVISQNSWGITLSQFFGNCHLLGDYTSSASDYDRLATGLYGDPYLVVFAAGNARGRRDANDCPSDDYSTIGVPATGKDMITVGAVNSDDSSMTVFSGWGPTDDGRLKPEIVAPGDEVGGDGGITSTQPNGAYGVLVGTSMAAPVVSGAAALLIEDYRARYNGQTPLPAMVKALLAHTAADLSDGSTGYQPGPDFATGYGRIQVKDAVDQLRAGGVLVGVVSPGESAVYTLDVPPDAAAVKVTLAWDDVPAAENAAKTLVNDLDLVVTDPNGIRHFPWTLDPAHPSAPALRTGEDHVNVIEQVLADGDVVAGPWTIAVAGTDVASEQPQKFSLVFTPAAITVTPLLVMDAPRLDDTVGGNGNGNVDPGEVIQEAVVLHNTDGPGVSNVTARLVTDSPWVRLLQAESAYPPLLSGAAATNLVPFRYRVSKDAACGQEIIFQHITTLGDFQYTNVFTRMVGHLEVTNVVRQVFAATNVPVPILDLATVTSTLPVAVTGVVVGVKADVRLDHTWLDDLVIRLRHPDGMPVTLLSHIGDSSANLGSGDCGPDVAWTQFDDAATQGIRSGNAPYVGTFRPDEPLSTLTNRPVAGNWQLRIADTSLEDVGTLLCWQLEIEYAQVGYRCEFFNQPPVSPDQNVVAYYELPVWLTLQATDLDEDPLTFAIVTPPIHGSLSDFDPAAGTVRYTPDAGYRGPDSFTFTVNDGYVTSDPGTVNIDVRPATCDLAVSQTVEPAAPIFGEPFTLTLTVTNRGPNTAPAVWLTNTLPAGFEIAAATLSQGTLVTNDTEVVAQLGPLGAAAAESSAMLTLTGRVLRPGWVTNLVTVGASEVEPTPEDNTARVAFPVLETVDLSLTSQSSAARTPVGQRYLVSLAVANAGPYLASNVLVRSELPAGVTLDSASLSQGEWTNEDGVFLGRLGAVAVGGIGSLQLTLVPGVAGLVTNVATVAADQPDSSLANNATETVTTVKPVTDLALIWRTPPEPVALGGVFTNFVTLTNRGPVAASGIEVSIALDPSGEFVQANTTSGSFVQDSVVLAWSIDALAVADEASLELVMRASSLGLLSNTAAVIADEFDSAPGDNLAVAVTDVRVATDLAVGLQPPAGRIVVGLPTDYTLSVTNRGPNPATQVTLDHELPSSFQLVSVTATQGTATNADGRVSVALGDLAVGETARVIVEAIPQTSGTLTNTVSARAFEVDLATDDNTAHARFFVEEPADLEVQVSATPSQVVYGGELALWLVVTNHGPYAATGVRATNDLPAGLTGGVLESTQGTAQLELNRVVFDFGDLPSGGAVTGRVQAVTAQLGWLTNVASVSADQPDLVPYNNLAVAAVEVLPAVDLGIRQQLASPPATVNHDFQLELTVTNRGPQTATGLTVSDLVPAGVDVVAVESGAVTSTLVDRTLVCNLADLAPEASATLSLTLRGTVAGEYTNAVTVAAAETELVPDDNAGSLVFAILEDADLAVSCTGEPVSPLTGQPIVFDLSVTNAGPFAATNVVLEDSLPPTAVLDSVSLSQGEWEATNQTVRVRLGELAVGGHASVTVTVKSTASGGFTNLTQVFAAQPDRVPGNNVCETVLEVRPAADLAVFKTAAPNPAALGTPLKYFLTVTNRGPEPAATVVLNEQIDATLGFSSVIASQGLWHLTADGLVWEIGSLGPADDATLQLLVSPSVAGTVTNIGTVTATETDPVPEDNRVELATSVRLPADLGLALSESPAPLVVDLPNSYTFTVTNLGPSAASKVEFLHALPATFRLDALTPSAGDATNDAGGVRWQLAELAPGAAATLRLDITPQSAGPVTNTATVEAFETDLFPTNNQVVAIEPVVNHAELALNLVAAPATILMGGTGTFEFTVTNRGPHPASAVVLTDALPTGLALLSVESSRGTAETNGPALTVNLGEMAVGESATVALTATAVGLGLQTNIARLDAPELDQQPADNFATAVVEVLPGADLTLTQQITSGPTLLAQPVSYWVQVTNAGPNTASRLVVRDTMPANTEFLNAELSAGTYAIVGNDLYFQPGDLEAGTSAALTLVLRPTSLGLITNVASVVAVEGDPNPADNQAAIVSLVQLGADLALQLTPPPAMVLVGEPFAYDLVLTNRGPHDATAVEFRGELPGLTTLTGVDISQGTWEQSGDTVLAHLGNLPVGAEVAIKLSLVATDVGSLPGMLSVEAAESDPQPADNVVEPLSLAEAGADLTLSLDADSPTVITGRLLTYDLVVTNHGPSDAVGVLVTNRLPAGAQLISLDVSLGSWQEQGDLLVGELGILPAGAAAHALFVVQPREAGALTNSVSAGALSPDPNLADNVAENVSRAYVEAFLSVTNEPVPPSVLLSNRFQVAFVVTNQGDQIAPNTQLLVAFSLNTDLLAADLEGGDYYLAPPGVVGTLGDLPPGGTARLTVDLLPIRVGQLVGQATLFSPAADPANPSLGSRLETTIVNTPVLHAVQKGNRLVLSWPLAAANFELESTDDLTQPDWQLVRNAQVVDGASVTVEVKLSGAGRFYRLHEPGT